MHEKHYPSVAHDDCPTTAQLKALMIGDVSESSFDRIEAHLGQCSACQAELEKIGDVPDPVSMAIKETVGAAAEVLDNAPILKSLADDIDSSEVLGDFRIVRELGRGGMGVVYEADQISLSRKVALKILPFAAVLDPRQLMRFETEATAAARLQHEHIVQVYQVGCERAVHFYAMRYIDGRDVAELIRQVRQLSEREGNGGPATEDADFELASSLAAGCFAPPETSEPGAKSESIGQPCATVNTDPTAVLSTKDRTDRPAYFRTIANLGVQAAEAMAFAHQNGILHRDIKPSNLMLDGSGKLWITDFGLARIEGELGLTMTGDVMGTLRYMSPEQRSGDPSSVDERSDVYSLGATLYEMLTLQPIYPTANRQELLRLQEQQKPQRLRQVNQSIPAALETIVLKAIAREPTDRYGTAQELGDDLRRFLNHERTAAKPMSMVRRVGNWARRNRSGVTSIALSLVAGILVAGIVVIIRDRDGKKTAQFKVPEDGTLEVVDDDRKVQVRPREEPAKLPPPKVLIAPLVPKEPLIFVAGSQIPDEAASLDVALGDFNKDGRLDVVFANVNEPGSRVWLSIGDGTFDKTPLPIGNMQTRSFGVAVGDLNSDGQLDLFFANDKESNTVWLGKGDGTFIAGQADFGKASSRRVALGDLDGDGDLDAVVTNHEGFSKVWLGKGNGTFTSGQVLHGKGYISQIALSDVDADGDLDAFLATPEFNRVLLGNGNGYFNLDQPISMNSMNSMGMAMGDINGDSFPDAVVANAVSHRSSVWLGDGHGGFREYQRLGDNPIQSHAVALGDLDGDGHLDVFVANGAAHGPPANHVWGGDGKGGFQFVQGLGDSYSTSVALGDLDNDGDLDAVVANDSSTGVGVPNTVWINRTK